MQIPDTLVEQARQLVRAGHRFPQAEYLAALVAEIDRLKQIVEQRNQSRPLEVRVRTGLNGVNAYLMCGSEARKGGRR